ncbi:hypothetical protein PPROV_000498100 [Pycnococcus provasolii]|uniref:Anaphase-promoting complex subunit 4 WD40 domain-containing protein n=1 Tax=Pycnococcus provasolii TaxID=41880 RepID=A0A830HGK3_9CHLO|nr:hypothetical protein PPROV_000498100 [Pycnococcus provasolii]
MLSSPSTPRLLTRHARLRIHRKVCAGSSSSGSSSAGKGAAVTALAHVPVPGDNFLAYANLSGTIALLDPATKLVRQEINVAPDVAFSLHADEAHVLLCGLASKYVVARDVPSLDANATFGKLGPHTGWVRALATIENDANRLVSCGCNFVKAWRGRGANNASDDVRLFTGDVLALAPVGRNGDVIASGGADGSVRTFRVDSKGPPLEIAAVERAHAGRVPALVGALNGEVVVSGGYDGALQVRGTDRLELIAIAEGAHEQKQVLCLALKSNDEVWSGGADGVVRRWKLPSLAPCGRVAALGPAEDDDDVIAVRALLIHHGTTNSLGDDFRYVAAGYANGCVKVVDMDDEC